VGAFRELKVAFRERVRVLHRGRLILWVPCIHRPERIESLLGANLEDAGRIAKLHIVLKLR
jgi:hypothetical protein